MLYIHRKQGDIVSAYNADNGSVSVPRLTVVIPAYNEEYRIGATLERMTSYLHEQGYPWEILVVDDGSSDKTREIVSTYSQIQSGVMLTHYDGNRGKGYAVRHGMLMSSGDYVLFSDADLSTPIEEVEKLIQALENGFDVAIGSRDIPGSQLVKRQSMIRELGGKLFNRCVQLVAVPGIHDTQCGFKLFTRAAAQSIFSRCQIDNFSFDVEVLYLARQLEFKIKECPVRWAHQEGSKVRFFRDALRMLKTLFKIKATDYQISRATVPRTPAP
jgi:dolichyl-phosphate beta-glucosyltransferase